MNPLRPLIDRVAALRSDVLVMLASAAGVLLLAALAAGGISWISVNRARSDLVNQGRLLAERYAAQSTLALLYGASDNARAATNGLLQFTSVVGVAIYDADGKITFWNRASERLYGIGAGDALGGVGPRQFAQFVPGDAGGAGDLSAADIGEIPRVRPQ